MTAFNFDPGSDIYVDTTEDNVTIRFDGDTFGLNPTSDGFSVTNDWNNRHFTLAFDENSILYHVVREDEDDRTSGKRGMPPEEFAAELYGYFRALAPAVPEEQLNLDFVGSADVDEMQAYLQEHDVVHDTDAGLRVDRDSRNELEEVLNSDPRTLGKLYQRVLEPVPFEEATDPESGENIFLYPTARAIWVLFMFPDEYVGVTTAREALAFADKAGGSQMMDHVLRALAEG